MDWARPHLCILFGPMLGFAQSTSLSYLFGTVFGITVFHHSVDCVFTVILAFALEKAKFLKSAGLFQKGIEEANEK